MAVSTIKRVFTDSGTTNVSGVTWKRSGNVITVSAFSVSPTSNTTITGLPTPASAYLVTKVYYGSAIVGDIQYHNGTWTITVNGNAGYGTLTYICN